MKRLSAILDSLWIFATVLMFGVGCTWASKSGATGPEAKTKTSVVTVFSKADLNGLSVETKLSPTNYTSGTVLDEASIDPETETIPAALGMAQQSNEFNQQMQLLLLQKFLKDDEDSEPQVSPEDRELLNQIPDLRADMDAILEAINANTPTDE